MKQLFILAIAFLTFTKTNAQSAKTAVTNHAFIMCDSDGIPVSSSGQSFFLSFYSNGKVIMLCGSDINQAIKNRKINAATSKTGTWKSSGDRVWFTWSDGKRSEDWILDTDTGNFYSGTVMMKDLGKF